MSDNPSLSSKDLFRHFRKLAADPLNCPIHNTPELARKIPEKLENPRTLLNLQDMHRNLSRDLNHYTHMAERLDILGYVMKHSKDSLGFTEQELKQIYLLETPPRDAEKINLALRDILIEVDQQINIKQGFLRTETTRIFEYCQNPYDIPLSPSNNNNGFYNER